MTRFFYPRKPGFPGAFAIRCSLFVIFFICPAFALDVEITQLDGRTLQGRLVEVAPRLALETDEGTKQFDWAEILGVRPLTSGAPHPAAEPSDAPLRFNLADGSSFAGLIVAAAEREFTVQFGEDLRCKLEPALLQSITAATLSETIRQKLQEAVREHDGKEDVVIVAREQDILVLRGAVRRLEPQRLVFFWNQKETPLPWTRVAGVLFAKPTPRGASCTVHLVGGDVLAGRVVGGTDETLTLQSSVFDRLALPWARIARIESRSDRLVFLSDLTPQRYEFEPFFTKQWPFAVDKTLLGGPLRLGGRAYAKGVMMHSRATLAYRLGGAFQRFAAVAGVSDEMGSRGCVTLRVLGNGRVLWEAKEVRGGQPPREVVVNLQGVDELVLQVDYDADLDLSDHACWAFARLIR